MSIMGSIEALEMVWCVVRVKPPQNPNRRTALLGAKAETYRGRDGKTKVRPVKGSGQRVMVSELILQRAGFEVFLPKKMEWRRANRYSPEKRLVPFPLLSDWVFVGWPASQPMWHRLMELDVVVGVLGTGGHPAFIPERVVQRAMAAWGGGIAAPSHHKYMRTRAEYEAGDNVRFVDGSMAGCEVRVVDVVGEQAKIMTTLLGKEVEWFVRSDAIVPAFNQD